MIGIYRAYHTHLENKKGYGEDASREAAEKMYEERKAEGVSRFNPVDELKRLRYGG